VYDLTELLAGAVGDEVLEHVTHALTRAPDPFVTTAVYVFGQIHIAVGPRKRLIGVAVYDIAHDSYLVALPGRDEWGDFQRAHNANQKARRARARAQG